MTSARFGGGYPVVLDGVERLLEIPLPDMEWPEGEPVEGLAQNCLVATASFGGFVAVCRLHVAGFESEVAVYTSTGRFVARFDVGEPPVALCFNSRNDHLIVVLPSGAVQFFDPRGQQVAEEVNVAGPIKCESTGNGVVIFAEGPRLCHVECQFRSNEYRCTECPVSAAFAHDAPTAICVIPRELAASEHVEALLATNEDRSRVFRVTFRHPRPEEEECYLLELPSCVARMTVSRLTGRKVAMVFDSGEMGCATSEMQGYVPLGTLETVDPPRYLFWVGEHVIGAVHLIGEVLTDTMVDTTLTLISPHEALQGGTPEPEQLELPPDCHCVVEPDCVRIITGSDSGKAQLLQVIPDYAARLYDLGSKLPAAQLRRAYDDYTLKEASSVRTLKDLTYGDAGAELLQQAIEDCLATAGFTVNPEQQQRLLRIAAYGKCFCPTFDAQLFVDMCRRIRVLNAVGSVGMFLTMPQLRSMDPDRLLTRLLAQHHHRLAYHIAEALGCRPDTILTNWAKAKLRGMVQEYAANADADDTQFQRNLDDRICAVLKSKLATCSGISYVPIAETARQCNRDHLFLSLLELEPSADEQIAALLAYGFGERALAKAIECANADLVFTCLVEMAKKEHQLVPRLQSLGDSAKEQFALDMALVFLKHFTSQRAARDDYLKWRPQLQLSLELEQYFREVRHYHAPGARTDAAYETVQMTKSTFIEAARDVCEAAMARNKDAAEFATAAKALGDQRALMEAQTELARATGDMRMLNASAAKTLQYLYERGEPQRAEDFAKRSRVPERTAQWAKLRGLRTSSDVPALLEWAKSRARPSMGYGPIVETLQTLGRASDAAPVIGKVPRIEERLELYVQCGLWRQAAEDCLKSREPELIPQLRARAGNNADAVAAIDRAAR